MRTQPVNLLSQHDFYQRHLLPKEAIENLPYNIKEGRKRVTVEIDLQHPEVIYDYRFLSKISKLLCNKKIVEINLGEWVSEVKSIHDFEPSKLALLGSNKFNFVLSELIYGGKIYDMDNNGNRLMQFNLEYKYSNRGVLNFLLGFIRKQQNSSSKNVALEIRDITELNKEFISFKDDEEESFKDWDTTLVAKNCYRNEVHEVEEEDLLDTEKEFYDLPPLEEIEIINECKPEDIDRINFLINQGDAVIVKSKGFKNAGMVVDRNIDSEILIDLNGYFDLDYELLLTKLIASFLGKKKVVRVDWNVPKPPRELRDRIILEDTYKDVRKVSRDIKVEQEMDQDLVVHTFAIFMPNLGY